MLLKQMGDDTHHGLSNLWTLTVSVESEVLNRYRFLGSFLCIYDVFTYRIIAKCNQPKFLGPRFTLPAAKLLATPGARRNRRTWNSTEFFQDFFPDFPWDFCRTSEGPQRKRRNLRLTPVKRFVALFPQEVSSLRSELRAKGNEVVVAGCSWPYFLTCFWEFHWKQLHHTGDDRSISDQLNKNDKKLKGKVSACAFFFSLKPITFFCDDHGDPCWIIHRWWAKLPSARRHQPSRKLWALQGRVCLPCCCILQDGL